MYVGVSFIVVPLRWYADPNRRRTNYELLYDGGRRVDLLLLRLVLQPRSTTTQGPLLRRWPPCQLSAHSSLDPTSTKLKDRMRLDYGLIYVTDYTSKTWLHYRWKLPTYLFLLTIFTSRKLIRVANVLIGCDSSRWRRRLAGVRSPPPPCRMPAAQLLPATLLVLYSLLAISEACSSRSTPKPRPPAPTPRPNITFHTYACPPAYATWYCLNGATCFTVKIGESLLYNCECADGYMGQRCEFKDLDGSYLPTRQRVMLETASIASGATIAVFLVVIVCASLYIRYQRRLKQSRARSCVDGPGDLERREPFSRPRSTTMPLSRITTESSRHSPAEKGDCPTASLFVHPSLPPVKQNIGVSTDVQQDPVPP